MLVPLDESLFTFGLDHWFFLQAGLILTGPDDEGIQYNVPYTLFPKEIDKLCDFDEKRKPVIRVNGERIDL